MDRVENRFVSHSPEATGDFAEDFATHAEAGDIFLLHGNLGAGKTTFVRGFLKALGHLGPVRSPTFNLIQTFETTPPVMHADLYRVSGAEGLGLEEYWDSHVCLIEWPEKIADLLPQHYIRVDIQVLGGEKRQLTFTKI